MNREIPVSLALNMVVCQDDEDKAAALLNKTASFFDEVVVVSDGPASRPFVKFCREQGFFLDQTRKKHCFAAPARRLALAQTESDWVFVIDPDEEPSPALLEKLSKLINVDGQGSYWVRIKQIMDGEPAAEYWHPRLFRVTASAQWPPFPHSIPMGLGFPGSDGLLSKLEDEDCYILHHNLSKDLPAKEERYTQVVSELLPRFFDLPQVRTLLLTVLSNYTNSVAQRLKAKYG